MNFVDINILDSREHVEVAGTKVVLLWQVEKSCEEGIVLPELIERSFANQEVIETLVAGTLTQKVRALIQSNKFTGDSGQSLFCPREFLTDEQILFLGLGEKSENKHDNLEALRGGISKLVSCARALQLQDLAICIPSLEYFVQGSCFDASELAKDLVAYLKVAAYKFDDFKSKKTPALDASVKLMFPLSFKDKDAILCSGNIIGNYVNFARRLSDYPPNIASPAYITQAVIEKAKGLPGITIKVIEQDEAKALGMGGFCAVGSGSENDSKFIIMEYKSGKENAEKIALVGKGVTFDTGGVSLKPADAMTGMKYDMSGATVVLATTMAVAELALPFDIVTLTPLVENMTDGRSYRQDDIVTFYNGKTAEIVNTDAEGRVILADALAYAEKNYAPSLIIDVATLTGACIVALGSVYAAVFSDNKSLVDALICAGNPVGEWLWQLPLHKNYRKGIESKHADISNAGARGFGAGTITATCFLQNFVEKTPWAHLDIAGKDSMIPGSPHAQNCSSGFGVRLLINYLRMKVA